MTITDTHSTIEDLLAAVFSVRSVPSLYNATQLLLAYIYIPETAVGKGRLV
jgi:hypothetical protein